MLATLSQAETQYIDHCYGTSYFLEIINYIEMFKKMYI
jgi:hypothetical protein